MAGRKKDAKMANRKVGNQAPAPKDDGTRYQVWRDGRQVYPGPGVTLAAAEQLASGLVEPAEIRQVA